MASRDIRDLSPFLQRVFFNMNSWYQRHFKYRHLILTCTYRSVTEQYKLYCQGRVTKGPVVTYIDGITKKSMHNYRPSEGGARAFDFAVVIRGKARWDKKYYDPCWLFFREAHLTRKIRWGRDFKNFSDFPHIQEV